VKARFRPVTETTAVYGNEFHRSFCSGFVFQDEKLKRKIVFHRTRPGSSGLVKYGAEHIDSGTLRNKSYFRRTVPDGIDPSTEFRRRRRRRSQMVAWKNDWSAERPPLFGTAKQFQIWAARATTAVLYAVCPHRSHPPPQPRRRSIYIYIYSSVKTALFDPRTISIRRGCVKFEFIAVTIFHFSLTLSLRARFGYFTCAPL